MDNAVLVWQGAAHRSKRQNGGGRTRRSIL